MTTAERTCTKCRNAKALSEFTKTARGYHPQCKACRTAYNANRAALRRSDNAPPAERSTCAKCKETKPAPEFQPDARNRSRLSSWCKSCILFRKILRRYHITESEYMSLFNAQEGVCAICQRPEWVKVNGKTRPLCIDHDHRKTGAAAVRGLLCQRCNAGIAMFDDDPALLVSARRYLLTPPKTLSAPPRLAP
jgi:hypothetical protein